MAKKNKQPKTDKQFLKGQKKKPKANEPDERSLLGYDETPSWCFTKCNTEHEKWKITSDELDEKLLKKLVDLESQTWSEILKCTSGRKNSTRHHFIDFSEMCKAAQKRAEELNLTKSEGLHSLALGGRLRLFGVLEKGQFSLVWHDPDHEVCESKKRHT